MTIRWLLACSLAVCCSLFAGCDRSDADAEVGPKAVNEVTEASKKTKDDLSTVKNSLTNVSASIKKAQQVYKTSTPAKQSTNTPQKTVGNPTSSPLGKAKDAEQVKNTIDAAITELGLLDTQLGDLEKTLGAQPDAQKSYNGVQTARADVNNAVDKLKATITALANTNENTAEERTQVDVLLTDALNSIDQKALSALSIKIPDDLQAPPGWWDTLKGMGGWLAIAGAFILGLLLLLATGRALINSSAARADARIRSRIQPLASAVQKQQAEFASQIADLTSRHMDLQTKISDLEFEIRKIARVARDAANDGAVRRAPSAAPAFSSFAEPLERDEPVFPISIGDYLSKMRRSSNIVRPDFQNDILVSDPDGTGELVLIRDAAMPDDLQPLFVVPRATQFQTKQDFYTYYQKYYECARPSAGDVWIIDPAVVSKVSGGWQLREKGVLEVR